jgi:G3E family GTPase
MGLFDIDKSASRLPVSLITGFLGSGKTTLLNKLLRHDGMADSAVIINEFGEVGLDHLLVQAIDGEVAVLASGCVCCTLRSDLEQTLRDLLVKRDRGEVPAFSRILVETTGLADPAPIVQLLLNNPLVSHFVRLDAVVTTIDAVNGARQIDEHTEAVKQAALADRLLLTKTDLRSIRARCGIRCRTARLCRMRCLARHCSIRREKPPTSVAGSTRAPTKRADMITTATPTAIMGTFTAITFTAPTFARAA